MMESREHSLDLRGTPCPLNFVRIKLELDKLGRGTLLTVIADSGDTGRDIVRSLRAQGFSVTEIAESEDSIEFSVTTPA